MGSMTAPRSQGGGKPRPYYIRQARYRFSPDIRQRPGVEIRYWVSPMLARHGSLSVRLREQQVMMEDDQGAIFEGYAVGEAVVAGIW